MAYQRREPTARTGLLSVEQERRRNAELARAIQQLRIERARLEQEAKNAADVLLALKSTVDRNRTESERMAEYREAMRKLPPPKYGGRDGLLAAVAEIDAHEMSKDKPRNPRTPAHGSKRRYYDWNCRCETCNAMIETHRAKARERYHARKRQEQAA